MVTAHHINLSVPEDGGPEMGRWLVEMLGYTEIPGTPEATAMVEARGSRLWWFEADDGSQVHLSPNPEHAIVPRVHTAISLDADLDPALERLGAAGFEHRTTAFDGERHAFVTDPSGNVWELVGR